MSLEYNVKVK